MDLVTMNLIGDGIEQLQMHCVNKYKMDCITKVVLIVAQS